MEIIISINGTPEELAALTKSIKEPQVARISNNKDFDRQARETLKS